MSASYTSPQGRPARSRPPMASPSSAPPLTRALSGGARPYHDSTINDLCTLETFQDEFHTNDFIAQLTSKLVQRSKADPAAFNPRPFIRTCESALDQLVQIRSQVSSQTQQLSSSVQVAESAYTKKLDELSKNFVTVGNSFTHLEDRISEVGRTAIRIGEQLETIDKQRNRASEAHDLIEFYYMFARGDTTKLETLRKEGGKEGRMKTAVIARRLAAISREVDVKGSEQTRDAIDRYCERFERDMLKLFDKFYRRSDPKMMSHIAKVLQGFNGGASCVQIYVNQHDFFISKDRVGQANSIELSEIWTHMADPEKPPPRFEPSLSALFNEIRQTVEIEAQIISAVFPNPLVVMQTFLQRVFAQSVQAFVEVLMDKAAQITTPAFVGPGGRVDAKSAALELQPATTPQPIASHLAYLRALHMARSSALSLVNDLKQYDYRGAGIIAPNGGSKSVQNVVEHGTTMLLGSEAVAAAGQISGPAVSPLATMLDQSVEELFVPYMEGIRHLDRESRSLSDLYAGLLSKFIQLHAAPVIKKKEAASTTIFNRMRNQISTASDGSATTTNQTVTSINATSTSNASGKTSFFKLSNLADRVRGANVSSAPLTRTNSSESSHLADSGILEEDSEDRDAGLSLDVAETMLRWHAEAVGRCVDLSSAPEVAKSTFFLLRVLASAYIKTYIETALDSAVAYVESLDSRASMLPELSSAMTVIASVELCVSLWQHYVSTALLPLASSSVTVRREMISFNNHSLLRVEGKCDSLMQKMADTVVNYLSERLQTQKRNDFIPKNDDMAFSRQNTEPCVLCCEALEKVQLMARTILTVSGNSRRSVASDNVRRSNRSRGGDLPGASVNEIAQFVDDDSDEDEMGEDADRKSGRRSTASKLSHNAETFLTEIGVAFHGLLLEHLRKYTISATGGLMLTKDLALYQDAISTFGIPALSDRFDMLRQLGNLFIVQASVLKSYMREGHLARIEERLLRPYLLRRADYSREVRDLDDGSSTSTSTRIEGSSDASASTKDLFGHIPTLINGTLASSTGSVTSLSSNSGATSASNAANSASGSTVEALKLQRLTDVLRELETFTASSK